MRGVFKEQRAQWRAMGDVSECNWVPGHGGPPRPLYRLVFHSE